ncbi:heme exporter protein CcmD [Candidatus Thioglobus autotrophicus]|uniref:heme exporter protein CcmD n=1 Tax=Candidatus Thioglobus autotrophicus TaxID=1705394 RepID=UPI0009EC70F2|nr:heme exporter protein CcmD [Candidatus Thioglobus autotrophicus]WPE17046.1 heme exporter protein CcmD [Candidatus Thioglobus autotrophicus]WPE18601.1 heme exporter protein CcmD [Candidatus Thioglobus autotrophicus]
MEIFNALAFDKYASYIWFSYGLTGIMIAMLFLRTKSIRRNTIKQLRAKYLRNL